MNTYPALYLHSFSEISVGGILTRSGLLSWAPEQTGPEDIRRSQVLERPYMAFGKLNLPDKLAFSAASLALRNTAVDDPDTTALFLGIPEGSLSTDKEYLETLSNGNPSPALFAATHPSSPIADIAIFHHLKGPNICFAGGDSPFIASLESAILQMRCKSLREALIVFIDEGKTTVSPDGSRVFPYAAALFLSTVPQDTPVTSCTLERLTAERQPNDPLSDDRTIIRHLIAVLRHEESLRIPVSVGGFIGYISLRFNRKEH